MARTVGRSAFYVWGEVIFDITLNAADFIRWHGGDSRDLYAEIFNWALEFEKAHIGTRWGEEADYFATVDTFACAKLREYFNEEE